MGTTQSEHGPAEQQRDPCKALTSALWAPAKMSCHVPDRPEVIPAVLVTIGELKANAAREPGIT